MLLFPENSFRNFARFILVFRAAEVTGHFICRFATWGSDLVFVGEAAGTSISGDGPGVQ